ncbi:phenylalanine--tRNA ligase subunit alpha [Eisenibacter elegans]|uniref:phenylalanine--tRNA ligase subunit alpha n=1 Tax=Eisenibacter elegans TaxID=997 RepID=UPI00047B133A|nr:phenylalanine--tRNA ligase subunit alpha [Eisenibacter elegans]
MSLEKARTTAEAIAQYSLETPEQLEQFRLQYLSKKGVITDLFGAMKDLPAEDRKQFGQVVNELKEQAVAKFKQAQEALEAAQTASGATAPLDLSLPVLPHSLGAQHPITLTKNRIIEIFERIGFNVADGPEIEDDWHNFTALNFPPNHPAREMQDTFFVERNGTNDVLLRTHTSNVQIRMMKEQQPPIRSIMPGRVYRNEAISARAHCLFHQVEGLYVAENVSFADLKQTLYHFVREMFGQETAVRFRPSYFPFTEPSAEVDISCHLCQGKGCNVCKYTGWLEILGCGMVDPNVLEACGIDPVRYTGFAFGMGIERIAMLKYRIKDLRLFTENDARFLRQFSGV